MLYLLTIYLLLFFSTLSFYFLLAGPYEKCLTPLRSEGFGRALAVAVGGILGELLVFGDIGGRE